LKDEKHFTWEAVSLSYPSHCLEFSSDISLSSLSDSLYQHPFHSASVADDSPPVGAEASLPNL